jgi:hypothetical protein
LSRHITIDEIPRRNELLFLADQVIREWVLSDDEGVRFDAIAMIRDLKLLNAIPECRLFAACLSSNTSPGAPCELKKMAGLIADLT